MVHQSVKHANVKDDHRVFGDISYNQDRKWIGMRAHTQLSSVKKARRSPYARRNSANTIDSTRAVHEINTLEVESASNGTKSKTISSQVPVAAAPYRHHSEKPFHPHIV